MSVAEKMALLEAVLYVAGEPVGLNVIMKITDLSEQDCLLGLDQLQRKYLRSQDAGLELRCVEGAYMLTPKSHLLSVVAGYYRPENAPSLSNATYETLAVIAYNEPVTKSQVESVRGVNSDAMVNRLLERGLVEERGQLDLPGRPMSFGVTEKFLLQFGLSSAKELPVIDLLQLSTIESLERGE